MSADPRDVELEAMLAALMPDASQDERGFMLWEFTPYPLGTIDEWQAALETELSRGTP